MRQLALILCLGIALPLPLVAQGQTRLGLSSRIESRPAVGPVHFEIQKSRWKQGGLIGAGVGAVVGGALLLIGHAICDGDCSSRDDAPVMAGSIVVFAVIGAMIGSGIHPKEE
jgi:hypothetical protein